MVELRFTYATSMRERFRDGSLMREWASRYPQLFDVDDVRIATNQRNGHFVEWLAAVLLFESTGYHSLVEKYGCKSHPRKLEPYRSRVPVDVREYLDEEIDGGAPDLFVFDPAGTDWFFCEVKGPTDRVRAIQTSCWKTLERMSGRDVRLLQFGSVCFRRSNGPYTQQLPGSRRGPATHL